MVNVNKSGFVTDRVSFRRLLIGSLTKRHTFVSVSSPDLASDKGIMAFPGRQKGFITFKTLVVLLLAGFILACGFSIVPPFIDNSFVQAALKKAGESSPPLHEMPKKEVRSTIDKLLALNNVRGEASRVVDIEHEKDRVIVNINYEVKNDLFANIAVLISFKNQLDSSRPDKCCKPEV